MRHRGIEAGIVLVVFMAWLGGCARQQLERFEFTRVEMGVRARVVTYAASQGEAERGAQAAFARVAELDACMSDYRADSELMRLCGHGAGEAVAVSRDLFRVLAAASRVSQASGGAFDVTVGPAVALWRQARRDGALPTSARVAEARERMGWESVRLDESRGAVTLGKPSMKLDLGGIVKGYAAQQAVEVLRSKGQARCLVALAGDICVGEAPPGEEGWKIEVAPPESPLHVHLRTLVLTNACVSTSGDREQYVEIGGTRYSHIIDPRTAIALTNHAQATVVGREGALVDAAATALCVLGSAGAAGVSERLGVRCVVWEGGEETVCGER